MQIRHWKLWVTWYALLWRFRRHSYLQAHQQSLPVVPVVLLIWANEAQYFAFDCEQCQTYHTHPAGMRGENPTRFLGIHASQCPQQYPDGYLLDWVGEFLWQSFPDGGSAELRRAIDADLCVGMRIALREGAVAPKRRKV